MELNKDLVKEINKISLNENEFLVVKLSETTTMAAMDGFRRAFHKLTEKLFDKGKVIIVAGDIEFTKITKKS